jgi:hypothetical protein
MENRARVSDATKEFRANALRRFSSPKMSASVNLIQRRPDTDRTQTELEQQSLDAWRLGSRATPALRAARVYRRFTE